MFIKIYLFLLFYTVYFFSETCTSISYMSTERPEIPYVNKLCFKYAIAKSRRYSRNDPRHYTSLWVESVLPLDDSFKLDFFFYQFLTNRYQPSFVELHTHLCDMVANDPIFGSQLKKNFKPNQTCPYPPAQYNFTDMMIPFVPKNFPFTKGRIYCNATLKVNHSSVLCARGFIDMEIKQMADKSNKQ